MIKDINKHILISQFYSDLEAEKTGQMIEGIGYTAMVVNSMPLPLERLKEVKEEQITPLVKSINGNWK